jgi:uncharacterized protein (TIGR02145 family)
MKNILLLIPGIHLLFICNLSFSQPPQSFKYQAVLRNNKGSLLPNKPLYLKISILQNNTSGNVVYSELQNVTTSTSALLNVEIGTGINKVNSISTINWGNDKYFFKMEIDTTGKGTYYVSGITQMLSVPYALNASGLTLTSPDGSLWTLKIDNNGTVFPVNISYDSTFTCGKNFKDVRNNSFYKTVQLGNQCWMSQNLNIGTMINSSQLQTDNMTIEKYCYSNNLSKCSTYGGLYTWDEMMNYKDAEGFTGICPTGWHIPADYEWKELEIYLGMLLQQADTTGWRGTNQGTKLMNSCESCFNAILTGYYQISSPYFTGENSIEVFWTSSKYDYNTAWQRTLYVSKTTIDRVNGTRLNANSVRCIRN